MMIYNDDSDKVNTTMMMSNDDGDTINMTMMINIMTTVMISIQRYDQYDDDDI